MVVVKHFVFRVNVPIIQNDKYIGAKGDNNIKNNKHLTINSQQRQYLAQCICLWYCDDHTNNEETQPEHNCFYDVDRRIVTTRYVTPWNVIQVPLFREVRMITTCTEIVIHHHPNQHLPEKYNNQKLFMDWSQQQLITIVRWLCCQNHCLIFLVIENDSVTYFTINGIRFELYVATAIETLFCYFSTTLFSLWCLSLFHQHFFPSNQTPIDICARRKLHLIRMASTRATMMNNSSPSE